MIELSEALKKEIENRYYAITNGIINRNVDSQSMNVRNGQLIELVLLMRLLGYEFSLKVQLQSITTPTTTMN